MTRKDYVAIAAALRGAMPSGDGYSDDRMFAQWEADAQAIADVMARDNPRFDRARFLKACGVQS